MSLYYHHKDKSIDILGQTYPHKEAIKALGGRFVGGQKIWRLPFSPDILEDVKILCEQQGGGAFEAQQAENNSLKLKTPPQAKNSTQDNEASQAYKVTELLDLINGVILKSFPKLIWVVGELQNVSYRDNKGVFFQLAEQADQKQSSNTITISSIIWPDKIKSIENKLGKGKANEVLQDGLHVRLLCQVNFYRGRANVSLVVHDIDPSYTQGALALAREKLLQELRTKKLDRLNKEQRLSPLPFKIGLISAEGSRAASDFLDQLHSGKFCGNILFYPTAMQGESTPKGVVQAIEALTKQSCDLIVLTRGGGSAADLRWFDDPLIAYAIAQCHLPVIAAIGHHDDYCIAEEICYHREKTPTAAADFILSRFEAVQTRLEQNLTKISQRFLELLNNFKDRQFYLSEKLRSSAKDSNIKQAHIVQKMSYKINENAYACLYKTAQRLQELKSQLPLQSSLQSQKLAFHLDKQQEKLNTLSQSFLERKNGQIDLNMQKLQHSDPVPWMQKGWTQLIKQGKKLQSIKQVTVGDPLMAPMLDGLLQLKVETITKKEKQND